MADEVKTLDKAESIEEFKALRKVQRELPPAPPAETPAPTEEQPAAVPEIAAPSESAEKTAQESAEKPKKDKTIDGRIKELRAAGKHNEANRLMIEDAKREERARADALQAELDDIRKPKQPLATVPAPQPQPPATTEDPEPKVDEAAYQGERGYEKYLRAVAKWDARQEFRAQQQAQQQQAASKTVVEKLNAARGKHADFDAVAGNVRIGMSSQELSEFVRTYEAALDVLYHLGQNPAEAVRISQMPTFARMAEIVAIAQSIKQPGSQSTHTPSPAPPLKLPVSKAAPPPRSLSAVAPAETGSLADVHDFEEFKRIRHKRG